MVRLPKVGGAGQPDDSGGVFEETPEIHERNVWVGTRVIGGTTIMFFAAFAFAYFYLRSLNNTDRWRPDGVDPSQRYGLAVVLLFAASAAVLGYAAWAAQKERPWVAAAGASLALGLAGCVAQVLEYAQLHFGPLDGGYASVFIGWTIFFVVFALLTLYWVEILLADGLRHRHAAAVYVPAGLGDAAFYWELLAGIGVVTWAILYLL